MQEGRSNYVAKSGIVVVEKFKTEFEISCREKKRVLCHPMDCLGDSTPSSKLYRWDFPG